MVDSNARVKKSVSTGLKVLNAQSKYKLRDDFKMTLGNWGRAQRRREPVFWETRGVISHDFSQGVFSVSAEGSGYLNSL